MDAVTRPEWGAAANRGSGQLRVCDSLVVHHEVGGPPVYDTTVGKARIKAAQTMHMQVRGWTDLAYNLMVSSDGTTFIGRVGQGLQWWQTQPGATEDENHHTLAICVFGNTNDPGVWTPQAAAAVCEALAIVRRHWGVHVSLSAHRDWNQTACPGEHATAWVHGTPCRDELPPQLPDPTPAMPIALLED